MGEGRAAAPRTAKVGGAVECGQASVMKLGGWVVGYLPLCLCGFFH